MLNFEVSQLKYLLPQNVQAEAALLESFCEIPIVSGAWIQSNALESSVSLTVCPGLCLHAFQVSSCIDLYSYQEHFCMLQRLVQFCKFPAMYVILAPRHLP